MPAKVSRLLVIDASVARSCGGEDATVPTSKNCRDFLQAVLKICHRAAMTPEIKQEWDRHQSVFAKRWRSTMVAKKKVLYCSDVPKNSNLWDVADEFAANDKERAGMFKNLHLLEAALATDRVVVSLDENTVRKFFRKLAAQTPAIEEIVWVNPDKAEEEPIT